MDKLCGPESLPVVYHRFSDGVDVLKCVSGFIKEVSEAEQSYANALQKLIKSPLYELHSNVIMQLLGGNPFEEIGTVKHSWSELGQQLSILAGMHARKAQSYLNEVRQPLLELTPRLEDTRKEVRNRFRQLRDTLEAAASKHMRTKTKYQQTAEAVQKHMTKVSGTKSETVGNHRAVIKMEDKMAVLKAEMQYQEEVYNQAYRKHVEVRESFDKDVQQLYLDLQGKEMERVNTIKRALQEFARTLSNTAPSYLEAMQRIIISMDEIDSQSDVEAFVQLNSALMNKQEIPPFEKHPVSVSAQQQVFTKESAPSSSLGQTLFKGRRRQERGKSELASSSSGRQDQTPCDKEEEKEDDETPSSMSPSSPSAAAPLTTTTSSSLSTKPEGKPLRAAKPPKHEKPAGLESKLHRPHKGKQNEEVERSRGSPSSEAPPTAKHTAELDTHHSSDVPRSTTALPSTQPLKPVPKPRSNSTGKGAGSPTSSRKTVAQSASKTVASSQSNASASSDLATLLASKPPPTTSKPISKPGPNKPGLKPTTSKPGATTASTAAPLNTKVQAARLHQDSRGASLQGSSESNEKSQVKRSRQRSKTTESFEGESHVDDEDSELLLALQVKAVANDYYELLKVASDASAEELSRARRERTRELHPDHYANHYDQQQKAQEELVRVNQAYKDVLENSESRESYDLLCAYRGKYHLILKQNHQGLRHAHEKFSNLRKRLKKCRCPQDLLDELDSVLRLLQCRMERLASSTS